MTEGTRAVSPPLPPDPRVVASPKFKTSSRDSVIADSIPLLSSATSQTSHPPSRASSDTRPARPTVDVGQPQPIIRDAVDKAIGQSIDQSPLTGQLDPSFIAQVTEAVVKNLVSANIGVAPSQPSSQYAPTSTSPVSISDRAAQSPVLSDASLPSNFTPPSPQQDRVNRPDPINLSTLATLSGESDENRTAGTQKHERRSFAAVDGEEGSIENKRNSRDNSLNESRSSRYASASESTTASTEPREARNSTQRGSRPHAQSVFADLDDGVTTLERAWRPLFDKDGKPTPRFSQFLRGIAMHIINEYEPKNSLVIPPAKLLRFLNETRLEGEIYPWQVILGGATSCASISTIYRKLLCQFHLIQNHLQEPPNLPSLTPQGFEWFMTCLVQAHPNHEYERLSQAIRNMPISNADNPQERFPKELPRRLLPIKGSPQAEQRIIASMAHDPQIRLRNSASMPPPPPAPAYHSSSASAPLGPLPERKRMPYTRAPHSNAFEDDDLQSGSVPSAPIERERKPYVAREGIGKVPADAEYDRQQSQNRAEDTAPPPRPVRQSSSSGVFLNNGTSPPDRRPRMNTGPGSQPPLSYANSSMGRSGGRRSPPLSTSYPRSDAGSDPSSVYSHRMSAPNIDDLRYNSRRTAASSASYPGDDEARGKPIPLRQAQTMSGYDSSYGSSGMPPPLAPLGSSVPRQRRPSNPGSSFDDRRRSAFAAGPAGSSVPDGWGSLGDHSSKQQPPRQHQGYPGGNGPNGGPMNH